MKSPLRIGIVGGGVAGLGCAYHLAAEGHHVEVFEQAPVLGGLAGSFDFDGLQVEKFYHFVCRGDKDLEDMLESLGLADELEWRPGTMKFFYRGRLYGFGTPWDVLRFRPLSLLGRARFGLNVMLSRSAQSWERYESVTARDWLTSQIGRHAFEVVWEPLLRIKFGSYYDQISASWVWHRIHRLARSRPHLLARERLGFLKGGTQVLLDALIGTLRRRGVGLNVSVSVDAIDVADERVKGIAVGGRVVPFDVVISTVPLPILARLLPTHASDRMPEIRSVEYIGVVCLLLKLKEPLTDAFWINVNDPGAPFNGFIEYTNLNPRADARHPFLLYVPFYLPPGDPRFAQSDSDLFRECLDGLKRVRPELTAEWVKGYRVFRERYAQAICTTNFSKRIPPVKSSIHGLFLTDSTQLYPSDRTISGMLGQARTVAALVEGLDKPVPEA